MRITDTTGKRFEEDIASFLLLPAGGYTWERGRRSIR